jgi:hypothetical protein
MLEQFNPTNWNVTPAEYEYWWFFLVNAVFRGVWAKIIASVSLTLSVYSIIRRKFRPLFGFTLLVIAIFFTYFGAVISWFD